MDNRKGSKMNCQCGKTISSPNLTGELCTSCYFKAKNSTKIIETASSTEIALIDNKPSEITEGNYLCPDCSELHEIPENSNVERKCIHIHEPSKSTETPESNKKYCQSCLERFGKLVLASREWTTDYFICDDCFQPLINNILDPNENEFRTINEEIPKLNEELPILNQFYEILGIPEALRFNSADSVLNKRNDIFNYHAPMLINKDLKQIKNEIEQLQVMLFQIKVAIEPRQDYINKIKQSERESKNIESIKKSKEDFSKPPSKVKLSQDQKMADTLFKHIASANERLSKYQEMIKKAREEEFKKRTGTS